MVSDVHLRRGLSCSGCHGGKPTDEDMSDEIYKRWPEREKRMADKSWIPRFCTEACHSQPGFMRRFNPSCEVAQVFDAPTYVPSIAYGTWHLEESRSETTVRRNRARIKQPSSHKAAALVNCIKHVPQARM